MAIRYKGFRIQILQLSLVLMQSTRLLRPRIALPTWDPAVSLLDGWPNRARSKSERLYMSHHATRSLRRWRRAERSNTVRRPWKVPVLLVGIALLGHLLVAVHAGAHMAEPSADRISESCAACAIGKGSTGVLAAVLHLGPQNDPWVPTFDRPPIPPASLLRSVNIARAPPRPLPTFSIS